MNIHSYIKLLPHSFQKRAVGVVIIGIINRLLDLVGLASLLPIIIVIMNPSSVEGDSFMAQLFRFIGLDTLAQFGMALGIIVLVLLPVKSVVTIWLGNIQNKYYLEIYKYYSHKLYDYYHDKGLLFIRQTYSAQLAFHINGACYGFATNIIKTILDAIANLTITLLLVGILVWFFPKITGMLLLAMIPVSVIYLILVRKKLKKLGKEAYEARRKQAQIVQESLKGHVSLRVNNSFEWVKQEFEKGLEAIFNADLKNIIYQQFPSVIVQLCVAIALIVLLIEGTSGNASINTFIVFGFTAIRIMPALLSLVSSWNTLQNAQYIIDIIKEIQDDGKEAEEDAHKNPIRFEHQIELRNVSFGFDSQSPVIDQFSLSIRKGESIGFRGASGSGKSTLFNLLLGFYGAQEGGVYIDGVQLTPQNRKSWHQEVGYVEQEVFIRNDSVAKNIAMFTTEPDKEKIIRLLDMVGLRNWLESLKDGLDTVIGEGGSTLSGGEKQRLGIARALYKDPQVLFVDEATSALDIQNEEEIVALLHSLTAGQLTLLMISHRESTLRHCDRIIDIT